MAKDEKKINMNGEGLPTQRPDMTVARLVQTYNLYLISDIFNTRLGLVQKCSWRNLSRTIATKVPSRPFLVVVAHLLVLVIAQKTTM